MEKDLGKIKKNADQDIIIRIDDFGGKTGLTIREYVNKSESGYKGFTKSGTKIPGDQFEEFKKIINSINLEDLKSNSSTQPSTQEKLPKPKKDYSDIDEDSLM